MKLFFGKSVFSRIVQQKDHTFEELITRLSKPKDAEVTVAKYFKLPPAQLDAVKDGAYVCPCSFSVPKRADMNSDKIQLVILDVDDHDQARSLDEFTLDISLSQFNYVLYPTISSTPERPKVRLMVETDGLMDTSLYAAAVSTVAKLIGFEKVNKESLVISQPMFLPKLLKGNPYEIISSNEGRAFTQKDISSEAFLAFGNAKAEDSRTSKGEGSDFTFLESPIDITLHEVEDALDQLDPDMDYHTWVKVASGLSHQFQGSDEGLELFDSFSSKGTKYPGYNKIKEKWKYCYPNPKKKPVTIKTILHMAREKGWKPADQVDKVSELIEKINNPDTTAQQLRDVVPKEVAKMKVDALMRETLVHLILSRLKYLKQPIGLAAMRKACAVEVDTSTVHKTDEGTWKNEKIKPQKWSKGMVYIVGGHEFFNTKTHLQTSVPQTDLMYSKHLFTAEEQALGKSRPEMRPQDYLMNALQVPVLDSYIYMPGGGDTMKHEGKSLANIYRDTTPELDPGNSERVGKLFRDHILNMLPRNDDAQILMDFLAHTVQFPQKRIIWAVILQGGYGIGKTYIARAMKGVLGDGHVGTPDNTVIGKDWTDWAKGKQMIVIEEVKANGENRWITEGKLKPFISNKVVTINERFKSAYEIPNVTNYLLLTNHKDAMAIAENDRRYCFLMSVLQTEKHVAALGGQPYFDALFDGTLPFPGALRHYLINYKISAGFSPEGRAPETVHKAVAVELSKNDLRLAIDETLSSEINGCHKDVLSSTMLFSTLRADHASLKVSNRSLSHMLHSMGYNPLEIRVRINKIKHTLWVSEDSTLKDPVEFFKMNFEEEI